MGIKTSDALVAALCVECHAELDNGKSMTKVERREFWNRVYISTIKTLIEQNLLVVGEQ